MKSFIISLIIALPTFASDLTPDQAMEIISINKQFSDKEIINNPSLCAYQNELISIASKKFSLQKLTCSRAEVHTNDKGLSDQLENINKMNIVSSDSIINDLIPTNTIKASK